MEFTVNGYGIRGSHRNTVTGLVKTRQILTAASTLWRRFTASGC